MSTAVFVLLDTLDLIVKQVVFINQIGEKLISVINDKSEKIRNFSFFF